ncbi:uncharacterized protein BO97DRAFT_477671 [Aspergillus homomorphus CBS 101889]|uniref:Zn(2)-C6 fungal-type domain-containing protein n=1 Tax=Aspergillus homomorphus (strain CBS 101889) TaxID=1450537 RepID=A0A395I246_ASPHC|nr:hypothetical protein BO97DRAFT_477671 [Aspergillus homomorphus CBS 101889]RAL12624.1 hypothetical protein BO97DRAFT_477671 [Aspergillus homomorphus CBS 101889]
MDPSASEEALSISRDSHLFTFLPVNQPSSPDSQRAKRGYQSCDNCRDKKKRCVTAVGETKCQRCQEESKPCLVTHQRKKRKLRPSVGRETRLELVDRPPSLDSAKVSSPGRRETTKERILSTKLLDASDALDLIAVASSKENIDEERLQRERHDHRGLDLLARPSNGGLWTGWKQFFLVKRGIVRAEEVVEYLNFYFSMLWHLFPIIPQHYAAPDRYVALATAEPVLTIALVALASRYHTLSEYNGIARSERVHWRTWTWVQKLFQSAMWGSSGMRSYGAIAALLLFVEWHPRAINSPEDFINGGGAPELFEPHYQHDDDPQTRPSIPEQLNLIATAYKSNKMSWMLISTAIALAQELGCFDEETTSRTGVTPLSHEWARILRTFLPLIDEGLALRLRLEPQLALGPGPDLTGHMPSSMAGDAHWESAVELGAHIRKARELLRSWRKSEAGSGAGVPLGAWEGFRRGLDRWKRQRDFSNDAQSLSLRNSCLDIEYYYVRLCGLSPAAHIVERQAGNETSLSDFADDATTASIDMLHCVLHRLVLTRAFRYVGVKIWLHIVCAALYLLKITLKTEERLDHSSPRIRLILNVVDSIKENSPDDVHLAQRYAALLEILVHAALESCARGPSVRPGEGSPAIPRYGLINFEDRIDPAGDWIYGSEFWDSLPDMVGLDSVSNLFIPAE